jgi:hypothetical protein
VAQSGSEFETLSVMFEIGVSNCSQFPAAIGVKLHDHDPDLVGRMPFYLVLVFMIDGVTSGDHIRRWAIGCCRIRNAHRPSRLCPLTPLTNPLCLSAVWPM